MLREREEDGEGRWDNRREKGVLVGEERREERNRSGRALRAAAARARQF